MRRLLIIAAFMAASGPALASDCEPVKQIPCLNCVLGSSSGAFITTPCGNCTWSVSVPQTQPLVTVADSCEEALQCTDKGEWAHKGFTKEERAWCSTRKARLDQEAAQRKAEEDAAEAARDAKQIDAQRGVLRRAMGK